MKKVFILLVIACGFGYAAVTYVIPFAATDLLTMNSSLVSKANELTKDVAKAREAVQFDAEKIALQHEIKAIKQEISSLDRMNKTLSDKAEAHTVSASSESSAEDQEVNGDWISIHHEKIENFITTPSLLTVNMESVSHCSKQARNDLVSVINLFIIYGELNLKSVERSSIDFMALFSDNASKLRDLGKNDKFYFWSMVRQLLAYHEKVIALSDWEQQLSAIGKLSKEKPLELRQFYDAGFSSSKDSCYASTFAVNATSFRRAFSGGVTLDEWFYGFWLRRYLEGSFDAAYLSLKTLSLFDRNNNNRSFDASTFTDGYSLTERATLPAKAGDAYQKVAFGVSKDGTGYISLRDGDLPDFLGGLQLLSSVEENNFQFQEAKSVKDSYGLADQHWAIYQPQEKFRTPAFLLTDSDVDVKDRVYLRRPVQQHDEAKVAKQMRQRYGNEVGFIMADPKLSQLCSKSPRKSLNVFTKGSETLYLLNVSCTDWIDSSVTGPSVSLLLRDGPDGEEVLWSHRQLFGRSQLLPDYLADLDNDGGIEVLVQEESGLGSSYKLVEVQDNALRVIQVIASYVEDEENYPAKDHNSRAMTLFLQR